MTSSILYCIRVRVRVGPGYMQAICTSCWFSYMCSEPKIKFLLDLIFGKTWFFFVYTLTCSVIFVWKGYFETVEEFQYHSRSWTDTHRFPLSGMGDVINDSLSPTPSNQFLCYPERPRTGTAYEQNGALPPSFSVYRSLLQSPFRSLLHHRWSVLQFRRVCRRLLAPSERWWFFSTYHLANTFPLLWWEPQKHLCK